MASQSSKDYYAILGVYPKAEDIVIRAAYKALAQRYHPDRYHGPKNVAEARMKELNEAYAVLSDPKLREKYDRDREAASEPEGMGDAESEANFSEAAKGLDDDWSFAKDYYSDLDELAGRLSKFSSRLAFSYRVEMLEGKAFGRRKAIADAMEAEFLARYFGGNIEITGFAKQLILEGNRAAAMELNRAVNVLGAKADAGLIIHRIKTKYDLMPMEKYLGSLERKTASNLLWRINEFGNTAHVEELVQLLGGRCTARKSSDSAGDTQFDIDLWGKHVRMRSEAELYRWATGDLFPEIREKYEDIRPTRP